MPAIMCHALALNAAADACCLYRTATGRRCLRLLLVLHCYLLPMPAACTALLLAAVREAAARREARHGTALPPVAGPPLARQQSQSRLGDRPASASPRLGAPRPQ